MTVYYRFPHNITIRPSIPLVGDYTITVTAQDENLVHIIFPTVSMSASGSGEVTVQIQHINPGFTRLRLIAMAAGPLEISNYHNAELIVVLTLNYPGFEVDTRDCVWGGGVGAAAGCAPTILHVQRWANKALSGTAATPGTARIYFTPNETPDAPTYINMDNNDETKILVQSQDRVLSAFDNGLDKRNTWFTPAAPSNSIETKFFQAKHLGFVASITLAFSSPQSDKWPEATGCANSVNTCPASNNVQAVYFGIVMPVPQVTVVAHAGVAPFPQIYYPCALALSLPSKKVQTRWVKSECLSATGRNLLDCPPIIYDHRAYHIVQKLIPLEMALL